MRIVDALKARSHLTPVHDPASEEQRQARRERQAAKHAQAVVTLMTEIPRNQLDFDALGGRVIEHVTSADGDYYRPWGGDVQFRGDDVQHYFVAQDGSVVMLERCTNPSSRSDLAQMQARKKRRRLEREAAAKAPQRGTPEGASVTELVSRPLRKAPPR